MANVDWGLIDFNVVRVERSLNGCCHFTIKLFLCLFSSFLRLKFLFIILVGLHQFLLKFIHFNMHSINSLVHFRFRFVVKILQSTENAILLFSFFRFSFLEFFLFGIELFIFIFFRLCGRIRRFLLCLAFICGFIRRRCRKWTDIIFLSSDVF